LQYESKRDLKKTYKIDYRKTVKTNQRTILLTASLLAFAILSERCKTTAICGMFSPRHEIEFINDSTFEYIKYYLDAHTNSFLYYSKGIYKKIDKNLFILNSYSFDPDSIPTDYKLMNENNINGFHLLIYCDEIFDDVFEFNHCRYIVNLDNYEFTSKKPVVDTIIQIPIPQQINLKLTLEPDSTIPKSRIEEFKIKPVSNLKSRSNSISIELLLESKYFNWHNLKNANLKSSGHGKSRKNYIDDDKWPVLVKK
jgi:hypothetical protein